MAVWTCDSDTLKRLELVRSKYFLLHICQGEIPNRLLPQGTRIISQGYIQGGASTLHVLLLKVYHLNLLS